MNDADIVCQRMWAQKLAGAPFNDPLEAVRSLCAVQSQDYAGAKWAVACRTPGCTDQALDRLFNEGRILRTHALRPTWHFVLPEDIRWLQKLTGPRVHAANAYYYRKLELENALVARSQDLIARALEGGRHRTRAELAEALRSGGIDADGLRLVYLIMLAELGAVICSGPLRGKQFTYALLEERVPPARMLERDESLATLSTRYFAGHGPATTHDFAWWSGLTLAEVKEGIALAGDRLEHETVEGRSYWFAPPQAAEAGSIPKVLMLPNYDEYLIAFKDRSAAIDPDLMAGLGPEDNALFAHFVLLEGRLAGGWRRTFEGKSVQIKLELRVPFDADARIAVEAEALRFGRFLGRAVALT